MSSPLPSFWRVAPLAFALACAEEPPGDATRSAGTARTLTSGESPIPDAVSRPATLLVHALGADGLALSDAVVVVDGRGQRTDTNGDAAYYRLPPGEVNVRVLAPGQLPVSRTANLDEGGELRVVVSTSPAPRAIRFDAAAGLDDVLTSGAYLGIPAGAVQTVAGDPYLGAVNVRWAPLEEPSSLGGLVGVNTDGDRVVLDPQAAVTLSMVTRDGAPLALADGEVALAEAPLLTGDAEEPRGEVTVWRQDAWSGLWVEQPDVASMVVPYPSADFARVELPQPGEWLLATAAAPGCVEVSIDGCEGSDDLPLGVSASWSGGRERRARSAVSSTLTFDDLPPGEVLTFELDGGGVPLASEVVTVDSGEACTPVTLSVPDCGGLAVGVTTPSECPANAGTVRVSSEDGATTYEEPAGALVRFPALGSGTWRIEVVDPSGATLLSDAATVVDGELRFLPLTAGGLGAGVPPGGCARPPCSGASCDACAVITVLGDEGLPDEGDTVSAYDPVYESGTTDTEGDVCFEAPDGVGVDLVTYVAPIDPTRITLGSAGTCLDESSCARAALNTGATCAATETTLVLTSRVLGWDDPGLHPGALDGVTWGLTGTGLGLDVEAGGALSDLSCADDVWATLGLESDTLGILWSGDSRLGCTDASGVQLDIDLSWPESPPNLDPVALAPASEGDASAAQLTLRLTDSLGTSLGEWTAASGQVASLARGPMRVALRVEATLVDAEGHPAEVTLWVDAAIVSAASAPRGGVGLGTSYGVGMAARDGAPAHAWQRVVVPVQASRTVLTSEEGSGPSEGSEQIHCLPRDTAILIEGMNQLDGRLEPFMPLVQAQISGVRNYRNAAAYAAELIPSSLYWVDRSLAETIYRNVGAAVDQIDTMATLIGRPARYDSVSGELSALHGFSSAVLRHPDGRTYRAVPLDDALQPTTADRSELYVFTGVAPTTVDRPYVLTLKDRGGAVVPEYTQRFAPVAGGVAVIAWPESD